MNTRNNTVATGAAEFAGRSNGSWKGRWTILFLVWISAAIGSDPTEAVETPVTTVVLNHTSPRWSPDGQQIVFERENVQGFRQIHRVFVAGGGESPVIVEPTRDHANPRWSPVKGSDNSYDTG